MRYGCDSIHRCNVLYLLPYVQRKRRACHGDVDGHWTPPPGHSLAVHLREGERGREGEREGEKGRERERGREAEGEREGGKRGERERGRERERGHI